MAKTCSSCGYQPIGPFTDNCPLGAEPVQSGFERRHASGRSPAVWWALIGAAVLRGILRIRAVARGPGRQRRQERDRTARSERGSGPEGTDRNGPRVATAARVPGRSRHGRPEVPPQVPGDLRCGGTHRRPPSAVPFVILHAGDEGSKLRIECFFDFADEECGARIGRLSKGQTVTVCGEYSGQISNVQVWGCALMK